MSDAPISPSPAGTVSAHADRTWQGPTAAERLGIMRRA